jgi:hypothetical protein
MYDIVVEDIVPINFDYKDNNVQLDDAALPYRVLNDFCIKDETGNPTKLEDSEEIPLYFEGTLISSVGDTIRIKSTVILQYRFDHDENAHWPIYVITQYSIYQLRNPDPSYVMIFLPTCRKLYTWRTAIGKLLNALLCDQNESRYCDNGIQHFKKLIQLHSRYYFKRLCEHEEFLDNEELKFIPFFKDNIMDKQDAKVIDPYACHKCKGGEDFLPCNNWRVCGVMVCSTCFDKKWSCPICPNE